jgi:hypothetical protein
MEDVAMKWQKLPTSPSLAAAWRAHAGGRRYTIHEIDDRWGDLYVLEVSPSAWGYEVFVDRDGVETDVRTSKASHRSKAEAVRAARKHAQKHARRSR